MAPRERLAAWLGIDLGTSSCKVVAIDAEGHVVQHASRSYPLNVPQPGWAEQDPASWWVATDAAVRQVVTSLGGGHDIRAIGVCGQMHGLTALDEAGKPLRPAILWNDQRSESECDEIVAAVGGLESLLELTNNRMLPGFTASKVLWMRTHEPELFALTRRILNPKDYLRLQMTGDYCTDVSDASGTGLFDVRHRRWSQALLEVLDLDPHLFPEVYESTEVVGTLFLEVAARWGLAADVPVVAGGGDSVLQTTSMGILEPGVHGITLGTAGLIGAAELECPPNPGGRLQISCGNEAGRWHIMGVSLNAGGALEWLRGALEPLLDGAELDFERITRLAAEVQPGSEGLLFLPYLGGERCPHVAPHARASWVGMTSQHTAGHLVRSVIEGVALNMREIRGVLADAGVVGTRTLVSGGATGASFWLRVISDVLGQETVTVTGAEHGGAFAAALLAGVGSGQWANLTDALAVVEEACVTSPESANLATYDRLFAVHRLLYPRLRETFEQLAATSPPDTNDVPSEYLHPLRAVVFDLDGTLADTAEDIAHNVGVMLASHGIEPQAGHFVERFTGSGSRDLIAGVYQGLGLEVDDARLDADTATYLAAYEETPFRRVTLFHDAASAMAELAQQGISIGVCTNKEEGLAWQVLEHLGVAEYVSAVVGGATLPVRKPHPRHLLETLVRLEVRPEECIYVGDTPIDLQTGRRAGVETWAADWSSTLTRTEISGVRHLSSFAELVTEVDRRSHHSQGRSR